jgi:hypothetical protein
MKVLSFILQRSFARYVALDLMSAAGDTGWDTHWVDVEGRLLELGQGPDNTRAAGVAGLIDETRASQPQVVFSYGLEYLAPAFEKVVPGDRRSLAAVLDTPAVYFLFDFGFPFDRPMDAATRPLFAALQSPDSLVLCWDREAVDTARRYGITHATHFPMAVNQRIFSASLDAAVERDIPIVFAGGPSPERVATLRAIADLGLQVYGYDPEGWGGDAALRAACRPALMDRREMAQTYGRSTLAVNVTRPHGPSSLNMRVYEAMASGCLLLTDDRADVHALFTEGEHLLVYRSPADLRQLVERYLADAAGCRRIATAGRERVLAAHTYDVRLQGVRPRIEAFVRQALLCRRLRTYAAADAAKALAFATFLEEQAGPLLHPDWVEAVRARCKGRLGDRAGVRQSLQAAFDANAWSLEALAAAMEAGEHSVVPRGLRHLARAWRSGGSGRRP